MTAHDPRQRGRNRMLLFLIFAMFFGALIVAGGLRFTGWQPAGMKNKGELLKPPVDLRAQTPHLADGTEYHWNPVERRWRILIAPPQECTTACVEIARQVDLVWQLFGKDANQVDILWLRAPPEGAIRNPATRVLRDDPDLRARLPQVDRISGDAASGVPVYVIDPNGFVILRYAPGFDPGDLRADVAKLLKLM